MTTAGELAPDEVRVDWVLLDDARDPRLLERYRALLAPDEAARLARYRFERNRHEFLLTRALARTTLARLAGAPAEALVFDKNEHGCPFLAGPPGSPDIVFNLSNTTGLVAIVVAHAREVGVDVEYLDRRTETTSVAHRFFSSREVDALKALPVELQRKRFFDYWTLKESYIKARRMGLAIPLGKFSFDVEGPAPVVTCDPELGDDGATWRFRQLAPSPAHLLAVCARASGGEPRFVFRQVVPLADV